MTLQGGLCLERRSVLRHNSRTCSERLDLVIAGVIFCVQTNNSLVPSWRPVYMDHGGTVANTFNLARTCTIILPKLS